MNKLYFKRLLNKYLNGNSTKKEQEFIESYYNLFENDSGFLNTFNIEEKKEFEYALKNATWDQISVKEQPDQKVKLITKRFKLIAAAILVIISGTSLFYLASTSPKINPGFVKSPVVSHKENRVISLPDGSTVIVSAGSKLNYPSSFDGMKIREVFLDGQAFFDIHHNPSIPFIVHTGNLETTVLGTAFNIKAISGEAEITVTVKRGKVKVTDKGKISDIITPNQQIIYNKERVSSDTKTIDSESYLDWKAADLLFDNLTIAEASQLLEERYKVNITITDLSVSTQRFTASFPKNESLEQALKSICVFNELTYDYNKERSSVIFSNK
ncbi:MAG: FecR domain-containing protein [Ginsengibacter sp.]